MAVRLRDVAGVAGVSVATASRALNREAASQVGGRTRERVWDAARTLGYVVRGDDWHGSREASDGGTRRHSVGLILDEVDDLFTFPFWVRVLAGIKKELMVRRCQVLFSYTAGDSRREHAQQFADVDGLIYVNTRPHDRDIPLKPSVTVDGNYRAYVKNGLRFDHVGIDMRSAMYQMVDHLLGLGRRRFGYLGPAIEADERTEAVHQGLALRGYSVAPGCDPASRWTTDAAYAVAHGLLTERSAEIDALICASDEIAVGAMRAAKELGIRLPDDLAITGFNDEPFARDLDPALTSLRVPKELMGELAARRLVQRIRTPNLTPIIQLVPTSLVVRASCGAAVSLEHRGESTYTIASIARA
jgi:DNA-binding LacI/PurR family transcriptional regulator